jgi:hypothetical protein
MYRNKSETELIAARTRLIHEIKEIDAELKVLKEQKKKKNSSNEQNTTSLFDTPNAILDMFFGNSEATNSGSSVSQSSGSSSSSNSNSREYKKLEDLTKEQLKECLRHIDVSFKTSDSKDDLMQKIRTASKVNNCLDYMNQRGGAAAAAASSSVSNNTREDSRKTTKVEQSTNKKVASKKEEKSERITSIEDCKKAILQEFMNKNDIKFKSSDNKDDLIQKIRDENKVRVCLDYVNH